MSVLVDLTKHETRPEYPSPGIMVKSRVALSDESNEQHTVLRQIGPGSQTACCGNLQLAFQTAVAFQRGVAAIGIVQQARCMSTGSMQKHFTEHTERCFGRGHEVLTNLRNRSWREVKMLCIEHALDFALQTVRKTYAESVKPRIIKIFNDIQSSQLIELIQHRIEGGRNSLDDMVSSKAAATMERIMDKVSELTQLECQVVMTTGHDEKHQEGIQSRLRATQIAEEELHQLLKQAPS